MLRRIYFFAFLLLTSGAATLLAQSPAQQTLPIPQWEIEAGGKMAFDVASVKQNKSTDRPYTNFLLGPGAAYSSNGGLFSIKNVPLRTVIAFAYKFTVQQTLVLVPGLPSWVDSDRFDIEARAEGNPTKDQMRLMVQSLLADRFKLSIHNETQQLPVFAVELLKPGKMGPRLQAHPDGSSCSSELPPQSAPASASAPPTTLPSGFPVVCGGLMQVQPCPTGHMCFGARNVTMGLIAGSLAAMGGFDRPVLDETDLSGMFDFTIEYSPTINGTLPPGADTQVDESAPTLLEALKEQLGLKLESTKGPVDVLVIDHVEEPSPN